ncbi:ATP-dependent endonuclease [Saccharophagus degradans]|uniref:ATP-dependent endonuclease n=1 Tax=Saccharophagus degradans TaxID=86304 RepID=UPI001C09548E|nr:ATP-dependent endonuclease [Saccharophagus degradans]MBU2987346.1 ATP-dependent endonuclease [Saccharophagus degradans]
MYISRIRIQNFRLLKDTCLDLKEDLSLLIGKNNTGKTSIMVLLEHFFGNKKFYYEDFSVSLRKDINSLANDTDIDKLSIRLFLDIQYDEDDDLSTLSDFILDLDPEIKVVKILFECCINRKSILEKLTEVKPDDKVKFIQKNLSTYLITKIYAYNDYGYTGSDYIFKFRHKLIDKELKSVNRLIGFEVIHARRNVASSEDRKKAPLSALTTSYFNSKYDFDTPDENISSINTLLSDMDKKLEDIYKPIFESFLKNAKEFLEIENLNVRSDIQSKALFDNSSVVTYGGVDDVLPEHLNGLGYMNILHLLLEVERRKDKFEKNGSSLNLLFIEEPEAHTHPQMQYVFAKNIRFILSDVKCLQTLITSHSPHIVSHSNFEDIRYLKAEDGAVQIKNFHSELKQMYGSETENFKFLEQYLNIQSAELFFASKVIFIEGITERMLLPLFINQIDVKQSASNPDYIPLASQNITIVEVGANAVAFSKFLNFIGVKTLIITDLDTTKAVVSEKGKTIYIANPVLDADSKYTSNMSLRHFLNSPLEYNDANWNEWYKKLISRELQCHSNNIMVAYQSEESGYHGRSFEDAFISINVEQIKSVKGSLWGLKNKSKLDDDLCFYALTNEILDKKSDFAASLLFQSLSKDVIWMIPAYIEEGLTWIGK